MALSAMGRLTAVSSSQPRPNPSWSSARPAMPQPPLEREMPLQESRCRSTGRHEVKAVMASVAAGAGAMAVCRGVRPSARRRTVKVARHASEASNLPQIWKAGPAQIHTPQAQKALYLLKNNPELFEDAVESELVALTRQRQKEEDEKKLQDPSAKGDALVLRRRMEEVRDRERMQVVTELLYLQVCKTFTSLKVSLIPTVKDGGEIKTSGIGFDHLNEVFSGDALDLVKEHLFRLAGEARAGFSPVYHTTKFQAGQVYAMSAAFGYYMRRVDARYRLEKMMNLSLDEDDTVMVENLFDEPTSAAGAKPLKDYIESFGPAEAHELASIASAEAQMTMEQQITSLFGDMAALKAKLVAAVGEVTSNEEAMQKLQEAIMSNEVESVRLSYDQLRGFILEAIAFGAFLKDAEEFVEGVYQLTPSLGAPLLGDDGARMLPE